MHPDILRLHARIEEEHWWFVARRRILQALLDRLTPADKYSTVLDLGCGTGGNIGKLCDRYECIGIELDAAAVEFARTRYPGCSFIQGSVYDRTQWAHGAHTDVCLLTDVLEHLDDDRQAVVNAVEALRPGGLLIVTVPAEPKLWSHHDDFHEHRRRYTQETLQGLFEGLPLGSILMSGFNSRLYYPIKLWRSIQRWGVSNLGATTTGDLRLPSPIVNRLLLSVFLSETPRLLRAVEGLDKPFKRGVSLLAVMERLA